MPNITDYAAPDGIARSPNDRASSAHVTAGRRIAQQYNEAGDAIKGLGHEIGSTVAQLGHAYQEYQAHKEISAGGLHSTALALTATQTWNDTVKGADPNDPTLQKKFMDQLEPQLQKFREGFSTQKGQDWADHRINTIREHMANVSTADMSTLAGVAAHNNFVQGTNMLTAMVDKDPSAIHVAADMLKENVRSVAESSPNMKGTMAAKFQTDATQKGMEQLVKAATQSAIRKGTDGKEISDDPRYAPYINAAERQQFVMDQRREERFAKAEAREQKRFEKEQAQDRSDDSMFAVLQSWRAKGPDARPIPWEQVDRLRAGQQITERDYERLGNFRDRMDKEETPAAKSLANYRPLLEQVINGEMKTMGPIWDAEIRGDLNPADSARLQKAFREMRTPEGSSLLKEQDKFLRQAKPSIDKSMFGPGYGAGALKFHEFEREVERKVEAYRKAGKDPHDLFDPTKPDYMGKPEVINKYVPPMELQLRSAVERVQGRPPIQNYDGAR